MSVTEMRAGDMIAEALLRAQGDLDVSSLELEKARNKCADLETKCDDLRQKISDLEHDKNALTRGYIAIMADNSVKA